MTGIVRVIVNGCSPTPVGVIDRDDKGFDETVALRRVALCFSMARNNLVLLDGPLDRSHDVRDGIADVRDRIA